MSVPELSKEKAGIFFTMNTENHIFSPSFFNLSEKHTLLWITIIQNSVAKQMPMMENFQFSQTAKG